MEQVIIGKIVNTHGIKGELKVNVSTDFIEERFQKGNHLLIDDHGTMVDMTVATHRITHAEGKDQGYRGRRR